MPRYANPDPMNSQKQDRCGSVLIFLGSYVICVDFCPQPLRHHVASVAVAALGDGALCETSV